MKKIAIAAILVCLTLAGCAPANIIASKWDSGISGARVQTRCERVDMRSKSEMDEVFARYDGWKLIYVSEYTTGNKLGTDGAVCFEHAK
jgi:hypothetical protein